MDEFKFIKSIMQPYYRQSSVIKGIGDDCAVLRYNYQDLVTAVDTMVDEVHFSRQTMNPYQIGYRVLAANLSDLAAMGAEPVSYMTSIVVPSDYSDSELQEIYKGMNDLAKKYRMDLVGGDTVSGKQLVVSITINGIVPQHKARYRSALADGDVLFVTGTLGDSRAGLALLLEEETINEGYDYFVNRHQFPSPRVDFSLELRIIERVGLNDVSDGISSEAYELAEASDKTLYIEDEKVPVHQHLKQFREERQDLFKYSGGEDFELIGAVSKKDWFAVKEIAERQDLQVTEIGYVKDDPLTNGHVFLNKANRMTKLLKSGYTHKN